MYRYDVRGEDLKIGEAKKIGKTVAVIVDKEWLGKRVVAIRDGKVLQYRDEDAVNKISDKIDREVASALGMYLMVRDIIGKEKHREEERAPSASELWNKVKNTQNEQMCLIQEITRLKKEVEKEKKGEDD